MKNYARFRQFVADFTRLVEAAHDDEKTIFGRGSKLLAALVQSASVPGLKKRARLSRESK